MNLRDPYYILTPSLQPKKATLFELGQWLAGRPDRTIVKQERIGKSFLSTIFLAIDHSNYWGEATGEPILWETMVFGGRLDGTQERCGGNFRDAMRMHLRYKAMITRAEGAWIYLGWAISAWKEVSILCRRLKWKLQQYIEEDDYAN